MSIAPGAFAVIPRGENTPTSSAIAGDTLC
jgi:hypothetical protein